MSSYFSTGTGCLDLFAPRKAVAHVRWTYQHLICGDIHQHIDLSSVAGGCIREGRYPHQIGNLKAHCCFGVLHGLSSDLPKQLQCSISFCVRIYIYIYDIDTYIDCHVYSLLMFIMIYLYIVIECY